MAERFSINPAVYLLVTRGDEVLLQRRFNTGWADGKYDLISGHIEPGEIPAEAVLREAKEEGGLVVEEKDITFLQTVYREAALPSPTYVDFFYHTAVFSGEPKIMEPDKCDELAWYPMSSLPENTLDFVKEAIVSFRNNSSEPLREVHYDIV